MENEKYLWPLMHMHSLSLNPACLAGGKRPQEEPTKEKGKGLAGIKQEEEEALSLWAWNGQGKGRRREEEKNLIFPQAALEKRQEEEPALGGNEAHL